MTVARRILPNFTTMLAAAYKAAIDACFAVDTRMGGWFAPHQVTLGSPAPDRAVELDAGFVWNGTTLTEVAAQIVTGFTIPTSGQHRIDRVVVDALTGAASRVAGTAVTGSPSAVPPAVPAGKIPVCQVLITSSDTVITDAMITDEREKSAAFPRATQALQEAASSNDVAVTPGTQHYHPGMLKAWMNFNGTGTVAVRSSYGMTGVVDNGTGDYSANPSTSFSSANYGYNITAGDVGVTLGIVMWAAQAANSLNFLVVSAAAANQDSGHVSVALYGDQ